MDGSDQDATEYLIHVIHKLDKELRIPFTNDVETVKSLVYYQIMLDNMNKEWLHLIESEGYSIVKELFYSTIIPVYKCAQCGFE